MNTTPEKAKADVLKIIRDACDQIEREPTQLIFQREWVSVTFDDTGPRRLVAFTVDLRFER